MDIEPSGYVPGSAPHQSLAPAQLPPELIQLTLEHLRYQRATLRCAALVSKQWLPICRTYLFEHICLSAPTADRPRTTCSDLYAVLLESPHIALYIRHLTILAGGIEGNQRPRRMWIASDVTLPALLDIFSRSESARIQALHMRLSSEDWRSLPVSLEASIISLINSPSMLDIDITGFQELSPAILAHSRNLRRVKFSETRFVPATNGIEIAAETGAWSAQCESLTLLDTISVPDMLAWASSKPSFRGLRELRLGFEPHTDVPHVEAFLRHSRETLEALHFQPMYTRWPTPANFIDISGLSALTSLRLSLGLSVSSNPLPWAIFILSTAPPNRLHHLTIDLRCESRDGMFNLPWADLDAVLSDSHLAGLRALEFTCFAYEEDRPFHAAEELTAWLTESVPLFLPRSCAREVFSVYELEFPQSSVFYWPGPLSWRGSVMEY
ncbi:hypothetical protein B0H11DRAFT_572167 [Mycena galericulata]|nr:hypothetical protein B0H11DRAFT_572167 [Mycena galericulata]